MIRRLECPRSPSGATNICTISPEKNPIPAIAPRPTEENPYVSWRSPMAAKIKLFDVAVPNEQNMSSIASARWLRSRFI
ncbi:MAG: hypothetical protein RIT23_1040 [Actinomycetota bacterium]